jgi:hypothetical protein
MGGFYVSFCVNLFSLVYRDAADQVRESVKQLNAEWADTKVSPCCLRDQLTGLVWADQTFISYSYSLMNAFVLTL